MLLRVANAQSARERSPAWEALALTQRAEHAIGYVSQPVHAALAGSLASRLTPELFGPLIAEVIDAIARHDSGWAQSDLAALEQAMKTPPKSFFEYDPCGGVEAWQRSIREAQERSVLAGIVTSRHFCLLAPKDSAPSHESFLRTENARRERIESKSTFDEEDLDRYTAAIGFCDLLSLCLCSGMTGSYKLPLAHPADPASANRDQLGFSITDSSLRCDRTIFRKEFEASVDGWLRSGAGALTCCRFGWKVS
jgi:Protein of unknown function (DUF3891)